MSYISTIPQASDDPSDSQSQLLSNFGALDTFLTVNHVSLNASGQGKHNFLQMPEQVSAPSTAANEGGLYTKVSGGTTELYWRRESNGTEIQLTDGTITASGNGKSFLPGGILFQWGSGSGTSGGTAISFGTAFTSVYQIIATVQNTSATSVAIESITTSGFTAYTSVSGPVTIRYMAVGLA